MGFKIENESEDQNQSSPKLIGIWTVLRCVFGPNLVILAWTADELWCEQAQYEVKFAFQVEFDLEGQGRSSPKPLGTQTKVFLHLWSKFGYPSLNERWVIVRTSSWLMHTHTHTDTDGHTPVDAADDNTRRPKLASGKNALNWCFLFSISDPK